MPLTLALLALWLHTPAGPGAAPVAAAAPCSEATPCRGDLDGDGRLEAIALYVGPGPYARAVVHVDDGSAGGLTSPLYPAWEARVGRLEGDAHDSLVLGAWTHKGTRPGHPPRRTVWVVGLDATRPGRFVERWRGSRLARPFEALSLRDLDGDGDVELLALERTHDGLAVTAYRWSGFGFDGVARGAAPASPASPARPASPAMTDWSDVHIQGGRLWPAR